MRLNKPRAWEITLLLISKLNKNLFSFHDVWQFFPYLKAYRSINDRLKTLVEMEFICYHTKKRRYYLTKKGLKKVKVLQKINLLRLRTDPRENEKLILNYLLKNPNSWINKISRSLSIHRITVRDVLRRLEEKNKIKIIGVDRLQRKMYSISV